MYGNAGKQYETISRVIAKGGGKFYWMNTSTGYVSNRGWDTYEEAEKYAAELVEAAKAIFGHK